jgi:hypothetical protein
MSPPEMSTGWPWSGPVGQGWAKTNYFSVRDGQIVSLVIVFNQPADY